MKLFYIRAEAHTGDADGPENMDLFVHADTPSQAVELWETHYRFADWNAPDDNKVTVYDINQLAICPGVLDYSKIPITMHKVKP